jgi:hypothetical protein
MARQHLTEALPEWREERAAFCEEHFGKTRRGGGGESVRQATPRFPNWR